MADPSNDTAISDLIQCTSCAVELPLQPGDGASSCWECIGCGSSNSGTLIPNAPPEQHARVRLNATHFGNDNPRVIPETMKQFIAGMDDSDDPEQAKRKYERFSLTIPVAVLPLDDQFNPDGDPFVGMVYNVSQGGLAIAHSQSLDQMHLAVEINKENSQTLQVIIRVVRCQPIGDFFEFGGQFVIKLG